VRAVGSALSRAALELAIASFIAPNLAQSAAPAASFRTRAAPTAQPRPPASTTPNLPPGTGVDFLKPILPSTPIIPGQTPLAGLNSGLNLSAQPSPQQKLDKCKCKEPEKKKREPTKPREVCYQGTYRQLSKGISYHRGKQVPCGAASEKLATVGKVAGLKSRAIGAVTKAAKRGKVPKLGDLARDVLGF
jgi:hypothetical protein